MNTLDSRDVQAVRRWTVSNCSSSILHEPGIAVSQLVIE